MATFSKRQQWLFFFSLLLLFLPYLYVSRYCHPAADDFVYSSMGKYNSAFSVVVQQYFSWSGRYTSNFLQFVNPIVFDSFAFYKVMPLLIIALTIIAFFIFIYAVAGARVGSLQVFILALIATLLSLYQMPILSEGIYWYAGAVTYQLGNICALVYVGLLLFYHQGNLFFNKKMHITAMTFLLIFSIGFNEIIMIALVAFAIYSLIVVNKNKSPHEALYFFLLCVTLIFSGLMFFAPGNHLRGELAPGTHRLFYSLTLSLAQTLRFFLEWTSSVPLLLLSFLYYYLNKKLSEHIPLFVSSFYLSRMYAVIILFGTIFIAVFPPYWATGILGQHRTLNVGYCLFLIMWFINLTVYFNFYKEKLTFVKPASKKLQATMLIATLIALSFSKNSYDVLTDIFYGRAKQFDEQMKERYALLKSPADTVYFPAIQNPPKSLFLYDVTNDPKNWLNHSYTMYFECRDKTVIKK